MKKYKFKATIQPGIGGGAAVIFPYNVEEEFGTKAQVPVSATLEGVPYRGSLVKCGPTRHMLGVLKSIREQIGKGRATPLKWCCGRTRRNEPSTFRPSLRRL
jgi:hypothetical protein